MGSVLLGSVNLKLFWVLLVTFCDFALGAQPRCKKGLVNGVCLKEGLFLTLSLKPELTLDACINECLNRKKCKSLNYDKKYPICKLYDNNVIISNKTCPGVVYMDISHLVFYSFSPLLYIFLANSNVTETRCDKCHCWF